MTSPISQNNFSQLISPEVMAGFCTTIDGLTELCENTQKTRKVALAFFIAIPICAVVTAACLMSAFPIGSVIVLGLGAAGAALAFHTAYSAQNKLPHSELWLEGFTALSQNDLEKTMRIFNQLIKPQYRNQSLAELERLSIEIRDARSGIFEEKAYDQFVMLDVRHPHISEYPNRDCLNSIFSKVLIWNVIHKSMQEERPAFEELRKQLDLATFLAERQRSGVTVEQRELFDLLQLPDAEHQIATRAAVTPFPQRFFVGYGLLIEMIEDLSTLFRNDGSLVNPFTPPSLAERKIVVQKAEDWMQKEGIYTTAAQRLIQKLKSAATIEHLYHSITPTDQEYIAGNFAVY